MYRTIEHFLKKAKMEPASEKVEVDQEIQKLLPFISKYPLLEMSQKPLPNKQMRVGVLFSGGQASGGHNVVAGLYHALKGELIGFLGGPSGLLTGNYINIQENLIQTFQGTGGFHLLGTGRTKIESQEQLQEALNQVQILKLDGLVIIGGDDSSTNAAILAEFFKKHECMTQVISVPKTIDGDLQNQFVPISFGFDTACSVYKELIGNLSRDCLSDRKYYHFVRLMGRSASHIVLECALATHPTYAFISEEVASKQQSFEQIINDLADVIEERFQIGKSYGVILIPEGLLEFIPNMNLETYVKDPHGNVHLSGIETEKMLEEHVRNELKKRDFKGKLSVVPHFFGYEGRSGFPSYFDSHYAYSLGVVAASLLLSNASGYMCFISNLDQPTEKWRAGGVPLASLMRMEKRHGVLKPVIEKALVSLNKEPFLTFQKQRNRWKLEEDDLCPGPMQYGVNRIPLILQRGNS